MPISTFPRHDYDEDEYLLKPAELRDTHSEGKVRVTRPEAANLVSGHWYDMEKAGI